MKEVKPAAMIGYRAVQVMEAKDKHDNSDLYAPRESTVSGVMDLREDAGAIARRDRKTRRRQSFQRGRRQGLETGDGGKR